mgnify:CR=1 FL=1
MAQMTSRPLNLAAAAPHKAAAFPRTPDHDLRYRGGRTIPFLTYSNYYLGGTAWDPDEARRIDEALWAAVADPGLNAVVQKTQRLTLVETILAHAGTMAEGI